MDLNSTVGGQNQLKQTLFAEGHIPNSASSAVNTLNSLCSGEDHKTEKLTSSPINLHTSLCILVVGEQLLYDFTC